MTRNPAKPAIRKMVLLSFSAIATLALAPAASSLLPTALSQTIVAPAFADGEGHGGGDHGGDHGGGGGHDNGGSHDSADHANDHASSEAFDHQHREDAKARAEDDAAEDAGDDDAAGTPDKHGHAHGNRGGRNNVEVAVTADGLAGLQDGSLKAVDSLGRNLVVKIETENGATVVKVHLADRSQAKLGPITGVTLVSAL